MAGKSCTVIIEDGATTSYILDQHAEDIGNLPLGWSSISHAGCGVVASYNALITLENRKSFDEVLSYFNTDANLFLCGFAGMMHSEVTAYFRKLGYEVVETDDPAKIDIHAQDADACILWYMFDTNSFPGFGAHFVEFRRCIGGYEAHNTSALSGVNYFESPTDFAYWGSRYYAIGIFIYDPLKS